MKSRSALRWSYLVSQPVYSFTQYRWASIKRGFDPRLIKLPVPLSLCLRQRSQREMRVIRSKLEIQFVRRSTPPSRRKSPFAPCTKGRKRRIPFHRLFHTSTNLQQLGVSIAHLSVVREPSRKAFRVIEALCRSYFRRCILYQLLCDLFRLLSFSFLPIALFLSLFLFRPLPRFLSYSILKLTFPICALPTVY